MVFFDNFAYFMDSIFAEGYIVLFIAGLLALLLGVFIIIRTLMPIIFGRPSIKGTVVGAVRPEIKNTSVDHKVSIKKGSLFPVFQYIQNDGTSSLIRGGTGGTHVHRYKTGQDVNLIINNNTIFNDKGTATDKDDMTGLYWGGPFIIIGVGLICLAWSVLSSLSLGFVALISVAVSLILRIKKKINKSKIQKETIFDFSLMKPIEEFTR